MKHEGIGRCWCDKHHDISIPLPQEFYMAPTKNEVTAAIFAAMLVQVETLASASPPGNRKA